MGNENQAMEAGNAPEGGNQPNQPQRAPHNATRVQNFIQGLHSVAILAQNLLQWNSEERRRRAFQGGEANHGPPSKYAKRYEPAQKAAALRLVEEGMSTRAVATQMGNGLSHATVSRWQVGRRMERIRMLRERRRLRLQQLEEQRRAALREARRQADEERRREILQEAVHFMMNRNPQPEAAHEDSGAGAGNNGQND